MKLTYAFLGNSRFEAQAQQSTLRRLFVALALVIGCIQTDLFADDEAVSVLARDSFEDGTKVPDGWRKGAVLPTVKYIYELNAASDGKRSLCLEKTEKRFFPIAQWSQSYAHQNGKHNLKITAEVKAKNVTKAIIDAQFSNDKGETTDHKWVAYIGQKDENDRMANHDWKEYGDTIEVPEGTKQITIAFQIYGPGKVWFDELEAYYVDQSDSNAGKPKPERTQPTTDLAKAPAPIQVTTASGAKTEYLLIPPAKQAAQPASGYPLALVLPGGDGSAEFFPFISSIHQQSLKGEFIVAEPIAPPHIVWPTRGSTEKLGPPPLTEETLAAIVEDVAKKHTIDRKKIYALAWSSSGPAVYATILQESSPITGAFIAMSVFHPNQLPPLKQAAGRQIYLLHSPEDRICPLWMAKAADEQLRAAGVNVKLVEYPGGHGWHGPVHDNIRAGFDWLQKQ